MLTSRLTTKYQTTIPAEVRERLGLEKGDRVVFEVRDDQVLLRRLTPFDVEYAVTVSGTLSEWSSENDEDAYRGL